MSFCFTSLNKKSFWQIVLTTIILSMAYGVKADTPTDAFQRAEHLGKIVERLLESDLHEAKLEPDPPLSASRPRHVLRLATYVHENMQFIRALNGLPADEVVKIKAKEVKPADVVAVLDSVIKSALSLANIYEVDLNFSAPATTAKKTPDEVLARLRAINISLGKLGAPRILPNDVYRISLGINDQVKVMTSLRGIKVMDAFKKVDKATPADALKEAKDLINDLDVLSKSSSEFSLPRGVATPPMPKKGAPVTPSNVLLATQFALADVHSLNVVLGYDKDLILPPAQAGRNPADVKNILAEARLHIKAMSQNK